MEQSVQIKKKTFMPTTHCFCYKTRLTWRSPHIVSEHIVKLLNEASPCACEALLQERRPFVSNFEEIRSTCHLRK